MAKRKIGLSPITTDNVRHFANDTLKYYNTIEEFNKAECDYARIGAAADFLKNK